MTSESNIDHMKQAQVSANGSIVKVRSRELTLWYDMPQSGQSRTRQRVWHANKQLLSGGTKGRVSGHSPPSCPVTRLGFFPPSREKVLVILRNDEGGFSKFLPPKLECGPTCCHRRAIYTRRRQAPLRWKYLWLCHVAEHKGLIPFTMGLHSLCFYNSRFS